MDHGGEAAMPTTVGSADLGMAGAVQGSEAHMSTGTLHGQLGAAAARRASFDGFEPRAVVYHDSAEFARHVRATAGRGEVPVDVLSHLHHEPGPGVAYPNIGEFWRQLGLVDVALLGPHLPDGVVQVFDNYGHSALQPRPRVVLVDLVPGGVGAVYSGDYALQLRPGAGHSEVLVDLLPVPDGVGHGEVFVGLLPGGVDVAYDNYGYYALLPRPGAGHGEGLVDLLPDGAGHGEVFVGLLPGGVDAAYDNYGYYALQPRPGAGHGEAFIGRLPGGVGALFINSGNFAPQTAPGTGRANGIAGALRGRNLGAGAGNDVSVALADDLGACHNNRGMLVEHLLRLLPFAGIGASSVAVNGFAAGPGSPAVAFHLFVLLLGGLFLVIMHVRV